jgi:two-component system cell cycle response regulator
MADTTILVIDDDQTIHGAVEELLDGVVDWVLKAEHPGDGLRIAIQQKPDVILLDVNMPQMDGFKVCHLIKENESTKDIPIIFLTVDENVDHLAKALDCGGSDYILKPFNAIELDARVRVALRTKRMFDMLREQARIDALTGLKNRAAMDDALIAAISAHERTGQPLAFLMIDLDHFKEINDTCGHGIGDAVLRKIGSAVRSQCRPYDVACRFGGDEFCVILGHTEGADAEQVAARILNRINEVSVRAGGTQVKVSGSAGLVSAAEMPPDFEASDLLKAADEALYRAKNDGRSRLMVGPSR